MKTVLSYGFFSGILYEFVQCADVLMQQLVQGSCLVNLHSLGTALCAALTGEDTGNRGQLAFNRQHMLH